jgi:hypothetical protein
MQAVLKVTVKGYVLVSASHANEDCAAAIVLTLTGTPPEAEVASTAEIAIGVDFAAREGCKAVFVLAVSVLPAVRCF